MCRNFGKTHSNTNSGSETSVTHLKYFSYICICVCACVCAECVQCFAGFDLIQGQCLEEIGEVDEADCCQNPHYGYKAADGVCRSCGPPTWSLWSSWSPCNVLCGDGVTQRSRKCYGKDPSQCENAADNLQTTPCSGTCCNECSSACSGPSEETGACPSQATCPVHGGWTGWSAWSHCSGSCISGQGAGVVTPQRTRKRTCSNPAPSSDTVPPGNSCPGDSSQKQDCSELPNCPVDGSWGAWSPAGPCSVSCGTGIKLSNRRCDRPAPKYGGKICDGPSTQSSVCQSPCPVDGFWSGWSNWGQCSSSCIPQGSVPTRTRQRTCSNPVPSSSPQGASCQGEDKQTDTCNQLPHCRVNGAWGPWSPYSSCPVTCGVGVQVSVRRCDSPAPQHGGQPCPGDGRRTSICKTDIPCPVDGVWSEWSEWSQCKYPHSNKSINCERIGGSQSRERRCLHRAANGNICSGMELSQLRVCYDVSRCLVKGTWDGWESWTLCRPPCGANSKRVRRRHCKPDYSNYNPTIGRRREKATFSGTPLADCGAAPDSGEKYQREPCVNVPACPENR
ncbi:properdin [Xyrichtys novacula]|uniref:Properdin n=1 Tax=Xyrichtys novacula TaxID=13765 RepID=A0AAV1GPT3_XYRNO|nr:properdin [Xyrichtys novacula]